MSNDDVLAAQIKSSIITKIKTQEYLPGELLPIDSPLMKYKGLMYDKQGHLAVFFENNMLIDRFGFIREVVL